MARCSVKRLRSLSERRNTNRIRRTPFRVLECSNYRIFKFLHILAVQPTYYNCGVTFHNISVGIFLRIHHPNNSGAVLSYAIISPILLAEHLIELICYHNTYRGIFFRRDNFCNSRNFWVLICQRKNFFKIAHYTLSYHLLSAEMTH